jgi:uncharacterized SAM-binding protein YcdF (DUF218 family)
MKCVVLTLGAPNDEAGNLSQIAIDRLNCVINIYKFNPEILIVCTGGFGKHFNTTNEAHASHAQKYLLGNGVKKENLAGIVLSRNTFEDFSLSRSVIEQIAPDLLIIITSDFHMERVKIIYEKKPICANYMFISATSKLPEKEMEKLLTHETNAIKRLMERQ